MWRNLLKYIRYSPYYGYPRFSNTISIFALIFITGFFLYLILTPREKTDETVMKPKPTWEIVPTRLPSFEERLQAIKDSAIQSCVSLWKDTTSYYTRQQFVGTGFLVEDMLDSMFLFLVTARHNFFDITRTIQKKGGEGITYTPRETTYVLIPCYCDSTKIIRVEKIIQKDALESMSLYYQDLGPELIDLAVYHLKLDRGWKYHFLRASIFSSTTMLKKETEIFTVGYRMLIEHNGFHEPLCTEGKISKVSDTTRTRIEAKYTLSNNDALITRAIHICGGESGSPVFLKPSREEYIVRLEFCGVLVECFESIMESPDGQISIRESQDGKIVTIDKVKKTIDMSNTKRDTILIHRQ